MKVTDRQRYTETGAGTETQVERRVVDEVGDEGMVFLSIEGLLVVRRVHTDVHTCTHRHTSVDVYKHGMGVK